MLNNESIKYLQNISQMKLKKKTEKTLNKYSSKNDLKFLN